MYLCINKNKINMNNYFKSARDNIFLYIVYIVILAFIMFVSIEFLRMARPLKLIGILGLIGSIYAMIRYPDVQKYLTTKNKKN